MPDLIRHPPSQLSIVSPELCPRNCRPPPLTCRHSLRLWITFGGANHMFGRKRLSSQSAMRPQSTAQAFPPGHDALINGIRYVGMVSPPGSFVDSMVNPQPCSSQSGTAGVRFEIGSGEGAGHAFLFADFASIWLANEATPRPEIPTQMIAGRVPGYEKALEDLLAR